MSITLPQPRSFSETSMRCLIYAQSPLPIAGKRRSRGSARLGDLDTRLLTTGYLLKGLITLRTQTYGNSCVVYIWLKLLLDDLKIGLDQSVAILNGYDRAIATMAKKPTHHEESKYINMSHYSFQARRVRIQQSINNMLDNKSVICQSCFIPHRFSVILHAPIAMYTHPSDMDCSPSGQYVCTTLRLQVRSTIHKKTIRAALKYREGALRSYKAGRY